MAVYRVCLSRKCGDLLISPLSFASAILQPIPVPPTVFCLSLKFCGQEQEGEALGVNGRVREQKEWDGKGAF